jgi:membrane protein YqaA with SNARE-associated domain
MTHLITNFVSASPASYAIVFAIVAVDALLPFVQAEAVVITAAVLAAQGDLLIWLVILAAALGGLVGDNASYLLGRLVGCRAANRFLSRERLRRAERGVRSRGAVLILIARFIPVGRTATTFAAGTLEMPWRREHARLHRRIQLRPQPLEAAPPRARYGLSPGRRRRGLSPPPTASRSRPPQRSTPLNGPSPLRRTQSTADRGR